MKSQKLIASLAMALLILPVLTACGPTRVDVAMTTYKFALDKNSAPAGEITFHVHNDAADLTHEMVIFKTDLPADQLPVNDEGIVDEEAAGLTLIDEAADIEPGASTNLTVNLEAGNYVLVCNIDSTQLHYQHGMYVPFTVK
jgi:uncharacterized cupredoxin-like copper-binding protein